MTTNQISSLWVDESSLSQMLIEAALSGNTQAVSEVLSTQLVDVNYKGIVNLRVKYSDCIQHEEAPDEMIVYYEEFRTDITPLFAAAHGGHVDILRRLLIFGADVNQRLYRGYATTAAAREGHHEALSFLLKAGASQHACEEALLEACLFGQLKAVKLLISSEMIRPEVLASALVHASCRGLVDIVATLIESGVDANSWHRVLLRSAKPALHASVDCTPLIAAIVSRHAHVVEYLLKAGAMTDLKARVGAWSWDSNYGEALRIGAGMAEPYNEAWCAVEYWEASGVILRILLKHLHPDCEHQGRSLLFHAILCRNVAAARMLLKAGANIERCIRTKDSHEFRPLHLAARLGFFPMIQLLIQQGCDVNSQTESGETALMICAALGNQESFQELVHAGADFGIANKDGDDVIDTAECNNNGCFVRQIIRDSILAGKLIRSPTFSPLHFAARHGESEVLHYLLQKKDIDVNEQDRSGCSAAMVAVRNGQREAFRVLVFAGSDISMKNGIGETVMGIAQRYGNKEWCENITLEAVIANVLKEDGFDCFHLAARRGNLEALAYLLKCGGVLIDSLDVDEYTPLMLAAKFGHADACKLLLLAGADSSFMNSRGETALILAGRNSASKLAEGVILDHMAKRLVLSGEKLLKHTKQGKGRPHGKLLCMLRSGVLSWGKSKWRNVVCKETGVGPSPGFETNHRRKGDAFKVGTFRIVTVNGREVHFVASSASNAELWARGISLITKEANGPPNMYSSG